MADDAELLRRYPRERAEDAFAEFVRRHLGGVYSAALRRLGCDAQLAEDVAQQVFAAAARRAERLADCPAVTGWLYATTRNVAANVVRGERRRKVREQEAHSMQENSSAENGADSDWSRIAPLLDQAIDRLSESERAVVLLRFVERRAFAEIGRALRVSDDAARMRLERALEKLRASLASHGVTSTTAALAVALADSAVAAPPTGMAASVTQAALAGTAVAPAGAATAGALLTFMSTSKLVTGISVVVAVVATAIALIEHRRVNRIATELTAATVAKSASAALTTRLAQAERRVAAVEKDNDDLLAAIKANQTRPVQSAVQPQAASTAADVEMQRSLARQREYQQRLAKRKMADARRRAELQETAWVGRAAGGRGQLDLDKLQAGAEALLADGDFEGALQLFNQTLAQNPPDRALPERAVRGLQEALKMQEVRVRVAFATDGQTWVAAVPYRAPELLRPGQTLDLPPGNYEIVGQRAGFEPVSIALQVRAGQPPAVVSVQCTTPVGK